MKKFNPLVLLLIAVLGVVLIGLDWMIFPPQSAAVRPKPTMPIMVQSQPQIPAAAKPELSSPSPPNQTTAPQTQTLPLKPIFVSQSMLLHQPPSVFELTVQSGDDSSRKTTSFRGVALSKEGKVLTLASFFDGQTSVVSASSTDVPVHCQGWLARDGSGPWIVLKTDSQDRHPAQVVVASYLKLKAGDLLAIPTPTIETPNLAQTVLTTDAPDGAPIKSQDELFWITGPSQILNLGAPVVDNLGHLVGLVDQLGSDPTLARVHKVIAPLPTMDAAVEREIPLDWTLTSPPVAAVDLQPFSDPSISQETVQHLAGLSGEPLAATLDEFLKRHSSSPLAWYLASMGYARAGKINHAIASAQMLTKVAPSQWQSWYLYGRQLEANQQFGEAADAYQQAAEASAPQDVIGLPLAASLFKSGNSQLGIENLKSLVKMRPDYYDAWLALGDMQRAKFLLADATHTYTHVLMLNPQSIPNWKILASLYDQLKNPQGSIESYVQLTLLTPDNPDIWYNLGLALLKANLPSGAATCLQKTLDLRPDDSGAKGLLARLDASPTHARQLLEKLRSDLAALPVDNLIDYSSIKDKPLDGKWEDRNLRLIFRHGDVHFRDRIDGKESSVPNADSIPVMADHSSFLNLVVAPIRDSSPIYTQRFDLGFYIPGFALYVYYKDGSSPSPGGRQSAPSKSERNIYRLIEQDISQVSTQISAN